MLSRFCGADGPGMRTMDGLDDSEEAPDTRDYESKQAHCVAHTTPSSVPVIYGGQMGYVSRLTVQSHVVFSQLMIGRGINARDGMF